MEVINTNIIGIMFIDNKNINLLSLKLNFNLNFEIKKKSIIKNGIKIPICFPKNISG
tara:strand:- start:24 stop:194 length:171 start_codon:yes stop_codon:yes gene_type:complete